jgi:hypothetical protein
VQDLALEEIGDGGQADVRVGPDVDALAGQEVRGPHVIQEDEGTHHPPLGEGQHAADLQTIAQVLATPFEDHLDHAEFS